MRTTTTALLLTACLAVAAPASAKNSQKFQSNLQAPVSNSVNVEIVIGDDLAWRGENLPKDRRDRGSSRSLNDGFAGNGFYGDKDLNLLAERLEVRMSERLSKSGIDISENATQTLRIILTDARPTRPTFRQMSGNTGLSMRSYGLGGAAFEGELVSSSGESLGTLSYAWYENDLRDSAYGATWTDARRAIDKFAKKTAKSLN